MPGFRVWRDEIEDRVANTGRVVATPGAQNGCIHRPSYTRGGGASVKGKTTLAPSAEDRWIGTNKPRNRNGIRFFPRSLRPRDTKPIYPPKRARVFSTG